MQKLLQSAGEALDHLFDPANLLQIVVIGLSVALGWWLAAVVRRQIAVVKTGEVPENLPSRGREAAWIVAPMVADAADPRRRRRLAARHRHAIALWLDVAVQLIGLLLLIRLAVYVLRVSLGTRRASRAGARRSRW